MSKAPKMTAAMRKEALASVSARREADSTLSHGDAISINRDGVKAKRRQSEIAQSRDPLPETRPVAPKTLPKVTLYAHQDVLKAIRRLAVDDGVQAQEILRQAVRDYLATRGHHFTDLTTGR